MKKQKSTLIYCGSLTMIALAVLLLPAIINHGFFGSEGDWYSQHVGAAEMLRQTILEQHTLFPQFTEVGGGSNIYDFAYYGLFRPDVLLSCLLPDVAMKYIVAGYMILGAALSANLFFLWVRKKGVGTGIAWIGAVLFLASASLYHTHHQIMFMNYMPFLIMALWGVDWILEKGKSWLFILSMFLVCIHSFYYAPACFAVCAVYWYYTQGRRQEEGLQKKKYIGKSILACIVSAGMAAVLLLPAGLDILSTQKDSGSFTSASMDIVDLSMGGLFYQAYGCGLTLLTLYCLLTSLTKKKTRKLAAILLLCMLLPAVSFILNGFLYARAKILIPFIPLLLLLCTETLQDILENKKSPSWILAGCCFLPALFSPSWRSAIFIDGGILLLWIWSQKTLGLSEKNKKRAFSLLLIVPLLISIATHTKEDFIPIKDTRQDLVDTETLRSLADPLYRTDWAAFKLENANTLPYGGIQKTTMYSSVTNSLYAEFYYNTMKNPISIQNRVALLADVNPMFQYFMGVRYLIVEADRLPAGYRVIGEGRNGCVIAENRNVLPVAYGTSSLLSEEEYKRLDYPQTIEALCTRAVVQSETTNPFDSHMKQIELTLPLSEELATPLRDEILFLSFHVESPRGEEAVVTINGMKNKLSSKKAPYPNKNYTFTYILSSGAETDRLKIGLSEGNYTLSDLTGYTLKTEHMKHEGISVPETEAIEKDGKTVFSGSIGMQENGYFITSYPYRQGYRVLVDGKETEPEKVNTAFLGFPLTAGNHSIEIIYIAPGFQTGLTISGLSLLGLALLIIIERKKTK